MTSEQLIEKLDDQIRGAICAYLDAGGDAERILGVLALHGLGMLHALDAENDMLPGSMIQ